MMSLSEIPEHARELHSQAILIDCHSDILNPVLDGKCRLRNRTEVPRPESWDGADLVSVAHRPTPYQLSLTREQSTSIVCDAAKLNLLGYSSAAHMFKYHLSIPTERLLAAVKG